MKTLAIINGLNKVQKALNGLSKDLKSKTPVVTVGYNANYALFVHEAHDMVLKGKPRPNNRGKFWDPQGRAKSNFLLDPARDMPLGTMVVRAVAKGIPMDKALLKAGNALQSESQRQVPVDTGNLKASAFTRLENS